MISRSKEEIDQLVRDWAEHAARRALRDPAPQLKVLVLGPSLAKVEELEGRGRLQDKREQIIGEIRESGHGATTPEELLELAAENPELESVTTKPLNYVEYYMLEEADLIVVLLGPPGSIAELAGLLAKNRSLIKRSAVFYEESQWAGGYVERGPLQAFQALERDCSYDGEDLETCRIKGFALNFVLDLAESLRGTVY